MTWITVSPRSPRPKFRALNCRKKMISRCNPVENDQSMATVLQTSFETRNLKPNMNYGLKTTQALILPRSVWDACKQIWDWAVFLWSCAGVVKSLMPRRKWLNIIYSPSNLLNPRIDDLTRLFSYFAYPAGHRTTPTPAPPCPTFADALTWAQIAQTHPKWWPDGSDTIQNSVQRPRRLQYVRRNASWEARRLQGSDVIIH